MVSGGALGEAVGEQQHLGVGMDGDEGLHVAVGLDKVHDGLDLRLGVGAGSAVRLGARAAAGARS